MKTLSRQLLALNMLIEDLRLESENITSEDEACHNSSYVKLLKQSQQTSKAIMSAASDLTEQEFMANINSVRLDIDISSRQLFSIYSRLLGFVVDFYVARKKVLAILDNEFTDLADKHLDLLQTKAIKARSQFKTVAQALGEEEYCQFVSQLGLPDHEWGWQQLRLSS